MYPKRRVIDISVLQIQSATARGEREQMKKVEDFLESKLEMSSLREEREAAGGLIRCETDSSVCRSLRVTKE